MEVSERALDVLQTISERGGGVYLTVQLEAVRELLDRGYVSVMEFREEGRRSVEITESGKQFLEDVSEPSDA